MGQIIRVGDLVRYHEGLEDGQFPADMCGEAIEVHETAQGPKKVRVRVHTGGSALIEEFRLNRVQKLFG